MNHSLRMTLRGHHCTILLCAFTALVLSSCGGPAVTSNSLDPTASAVVTVTTEATPSTPLADRVACGDGRMLVGDLRLMDNKWQDGLKAATEKAIRWQTDAKLATLRVGCELLESGFRWQATFYSPSSQAYFQSDTGQVEAAEDDPSSVPVLSTPGLSFAVLRKSLNGEGYDDSTELSPSTGVEIKPSTPTSQFGPPEAPNNATIFHVAIEFRGEVKDLFVDMRDGKVYRYKFD